MPVGGIVSALSKYQQQGCKLGGLCFSLRLLFNLPKAPGVESKGAQRDPLQVWGACAPLPPGVSRDTLPQNTLRAEVGLGEPLIGWGGEGLGEWFTSILPCSSSEEGKAKRDAGKPNSQILFVFFYFFIFFSLCVPPLLLLLFLSLGKPV